MKKVNLKVTKKRKKKFPFSYHVEVWKLGLIALGILLLLTPFLNKDILYKFMPHAASNVYIGVWQNGMPQDMTTLTAFEQDAHKHMAIVMFWRDYGGTKSVLDTTWLQNIYNHGSIPLITWATANWDGGDQTPYTLDNIIAGTQDTYMIGWAQQIASYGKPVMIRWDHEMNGNWYTWGQQPSSKYIAAWKHVHDLFVAHGATNVLWVWSPNIWQSSDGTLSDARQYYPGDNYVDWIGIDGYNKNLTSWQTFHQVFDWSYNALTAMSQKHLMIAETSSGEATSTQASQGLSKASWITDAFGSAIQSMPRIEAALWFNEDKTVEEGYDWRIESSTAATSAFAQAVSSSFYLDTWPYGNTASPTPYITNFPTVTNTPTIILTPTFGITDSTPPTVTLTLPQNGATYARKSTLTLAAAATDNIGVTKVVFTTSSGFSSTDTTYPYQTTWQVPPGNNVTSYTIKATAYDAAGNFATSQLTIHSR